MVAALASDTVKLVVCSVWPGAGANWSTACVNSRVFEYPVTTTWKPDDDVVAVTALMTGTAGAIWIVWVNAAGVAKAAPPACQLTVSVMVPATVPVWSEKGIGAVLFAGMLKLAVVPPVENWMDGSAAGEANEASGWKASVTWPLISCGYAAPSVNAPLTCFAEVAVLDSPVKLADITVSVKVAEFVALVLSVT